MTGFVGLASGNAVVKGSRAPESMISRATHDGTQTLTLGTSPRRGLTSASAISQCWLTFARSSHRISLRPSIWLIFGASWPANGAFGGVLGWFLHLGPRKCTLSGSIPILASSCSRLSTAVMATDLTQTSRVRKRWLPKAVG